MSYTSAPHEDDEMFEMDSKDSGSGYEDRSSMFAEDANDKVVVSSAAATLQHSEMVNRPNSLNVSQSLASPTSSTVTENSGQKYVSSSSLKTKPSAELGSDNASSTGNPTSPLDSFRSWSSGALLYARQYFSEHLGRRGNGLTAVGDPDTVARVTALREQQRHYARLLKISTTLAVQLEQMIRTQRALGSAFGELSHCGGDIALGEQFACSTDVMRLMSKQGDLLLASLGVFRQSLLTLCNTTIEDTMSTVKRCDAVRIKYEALRSRVASMRAAQNFSRDATLLARLREAETALAAQKLKYDRILNDLVIKLKFLEDNKVSVCQKHLFLLHKAYAAYVSGNHQGVEEIVKRFQLAESASMTTSCLAVERMAIKPPVSTNG